MSNVYFCAGEFCPGYHWPASNTPHPTSCAIIGLNSGAALDEAAERRRQHGREVSWARPVFRESPSASGDPK